jgi:hypothetical protein
VFNKVLVTQEPNFDYTDYIVFDMHTMDGTTIEYNIQNFVAFTINGCAVDAREILDTPWEKSLIEVLPGALQDIKDKRLRLNRNGYKGMPSNFYAMLRFISVGFSPPSPEDVQLLLAELPRLDHLRFTRNVEKVWSYVGGEAKARELVKSLGINFDVFNEAEVRAKL